VRVFVSSTYSDLIDHRAAVIDMLLRMNLAPSAMEHFGSRSAEPAQACLEEIDRCDVFIGIYGSRYGYQNVPGGPSITEQEFDHALRRRDKILILCYVLADRIEPAVTGEPQESVRRLTLFKTRVREDLVCDTFTTPEMLASRVAAALAAEIQRQSRLATGDLSAVNWSQYSDNVRSSMWTLLTSSGTAHQQETLRSVVNVLAARFAPDALTVGTSEEAARAAFVGRHEFFGSLLYDRGHDDYIPFDPESTEIFIRARQRPITELITSLETPQQRELLNRFVGLCRQIGMFTESGTFNGVFLDDARASKHRLSAPTNAVLQLTQACSYDCEHCLFGAGRPLLGELTSVEVTALIDELAACGCYLLVLDGGEPLLRPDFPAIVEHATYRGLAVRVATNGAGATQQIVDALARLQIQSFKLRLEAGTAEQLNAIRGHPGAFDETMEGVRRLKGLGVPIDLHCVLTRRNAGDMPALAELVANLQLSRLTVHVAQAVGRAGERPDILLSGEEAEAVRVLLPGIAKQMGIEIACSGGSRQRLFPNRCDCGTLACHVDARGGVSPSGFRAAAVGDTIRERRLTDIWATSSAFAMARASEVQAPCASCNYYSG
jgi:MoaA/NifB/PqqE/SkfB family radical SAM enzyme